MTWLAAGLVGAGLGLVCFGGLWLTVRQLPRGAGRALLVASTAARLGLVGLVLYALGREGPGQMLAGLGGLWLTRWCLLRRLGGGPPAFSPLSRGSQNREAERGSANRG